MVPNDGREGRAIVSKSWDHRPWEVSLAVRLSAAPRGASAARRMKFSSSHLNRYRQIVSLLWKYGHADLAKQMSAEEGFGSAEAAADDGAPASAAPVPAGGASP